MLTPFTESGSVDLDGLDSLTEWYINCGVSGLFSVCLSSEMYDLTDEERIAIAKRVVDRTAGRVPVFASGTFGGDTEAQGASIVRMSETGVDGVVVIVSQMAHDGEDESVWRLNVEQMLTRTGDVRLGLYECPRPYHRLLTTETLGWSAETGRFDFTKDTSCREDDIVGKIQESRGTSLQFYDACAATLWTTLENGGDGFCGISGNFYADLYVWLCEHFDKEPETARRLHRFLSVAERAIGVDYPVSAKLFLSRSGLPIRSDCRAKSATFDERDLRILRDLEGMVAEWRERVGSSLARGWQ
ncbi:MAG: dihydrodipicolinate synthase family protein [Dehalococcoidia bacterium]|nr:dihydrodipicolinate synthase family protein [Dehalococcoidia bacterium]